VIINIEPQGDKLLLTIFDDGIGFVYQDIAPRNKGLGLRNLESRAEILGAQLHFQSNPGKGTQYVFEIPL
jgi:signal transduction histidine kinase